METYEQNFWSENISVKRKKLNNNINTTKKQKNKYKNIY